MPLVKSNFRSAEMFAEFGLEKQKEGKRESASGWGSHIDRTENTREFLVDALTRYNIKSMLDLGCGDWWWMKEIREHLKDVDYEGWDAHEGMLSDLTEKYGNDKTRFLYKDIVDNEYPTVDLAFCRDVLFHLKIENTQKILKNLRDAKIKYFMTTTFLEAEKNTDIRPRADIPNWGFYEINLNRAPFNLEDNMVDYSEESLPPSNGMKRFLCMYQLF